MQNSPACGFGAFGAGHDVYLFVAAQNSGKLGRLVGAIVSLIEQQNERGMGVETKR